MQLFPTARQVKAVGPTVFHAQKNGKPCDRIGHILFSKKNKYSDSTKTFCETDIINMLTFWLTAYLLCLVDVFFNRHHTYRYKLCSSSRQRIPVFAWGRFHTGSSQEKRTKASPILQFHVPLSRWCPFTIYFSFVISLIAYICPIELEIYNKGNIKITELRTILQRESQNS